MRYQHTLMASVLTLAVGLASCQKANENTSANPSVAASSEKLLDGSTGDDWPGYGRTYGEQHFSQLTDINSDTVGKLNLAWSLDLPPGNSNTVPISVDGVVYFARGYSVIYAVDAVSGKLLWTFDPEVPAVAGTKLRGGWGSRGIAWWNGKVYTGTADGRLIAVDAKTGKQIWSVQTLQGDDGRYITGAPRVFAGKVVIGHGGADFSAARGYVTAYDAETGKQAWRFFTVPGDPAKGFESKALEMAAKTWSGEYWKKGGGGTVWNAMAYDAEADTLLIGTGNGSPWNHRVRSDGKGDNLFLCSIVAIDAKTGVYKWHYQINPGESWDYNAAMDIQLADLIIDGKPRKVAITAPKNGFFYVIDRLNGKLISAEPFAVTTWAKKIDLATGRPIENPEARYANGKDFLLRPSTIGAHSWMPMAFSPQTGLTYIPTMEMANTINDKGVDLKNWKRPPGVQGDGSANYAFILDGSIPGLETSSLLAWNPVTQKPAWRVATPSFWNGGVLATAGKLVFQGQVDGKFKAYEASTGKVLWTFEAQDAVISPPISYRVNGKQYITVISGAGTGGAAFGPLLEKYPLDYYTQKRRVLTFALDGGAKLPPVEPTVRQPLLPDPTFRADPASAKRGMMTFGIHCGFCHGLDLVGAGNAPDLRRSAVPLDADAFNSVVRDGERVPLGMPRFDELTDGERADIRQYVRTRRRQ